MITLPARLIVRLRFPILILWAAVAAIAVPGARRAGEVLRVEGQAASTESEQVYRLVREAFDRPLAQYFAVAVRGPMPVDSPPFAALIDDLAATLRSEPYLRQVISLRDANEPGLVSGDRRSTFLVAVLTPETSGAALLKTPDVRAAVRGVMDRGGASSRFDVHVTGAPALEYDVRTTSLEDARRGERRSLPLAGVVLILAFGALVAAVLPLVVGVFAITCALAMVYVAALVHPMSVFVLNLISMIGLGVGIDYSLLVVTRFREELNRGQPVREAAVRTIATAGRAVVTSGLTVVVGFAGLVVIPLPETRSIALGGVFVVGAAVALSVTLLPAALSLLGRAIDQPKWLARRLAWYHAPIGWERWARWLGHHPWRAVAIGGIAVAAITWPLFQIRIGLPQAGWFPAGTDSDRGAEMLEAMGSRGAVQPVRVILRAPEGSRIVAARYLRGLRRFSDSIQADPRVARVRSPVDIRPNLSTLSYSMLYSDLERARTRYPEFLGAHLSPDGRTALLDIQLADSTSLLTAMEVVRDVRRSARSDFRGLDSVDVLVGGFVASGVDLQDQLLGRFPLLVAVVLITTAVMLFVAFQSVLVPLKAVVMNCLSVAGAFGLIVLVFQHGVGAGMFHLTTGTGAIYVLVPVLVFAVVFGLSMDYEVFLLSRVKEAFDRTGRNDQATMEGLSATASTITSAALIMIIVFGTFSLAKVLAVQLIGFGLAVAVFLDATLIRMVLVPAIMHIAGRWNWWPGVRQSREG
ncbi:MAG TPA: MMPL family transporter [Gemmatimonadales bacterium]|nr:MMPL family transporter [Gemmatimonadales bacterium]